MKAETIKAKVVVAGNCLLCGKPIDDNNIFICNDCKKKQEEKSMTREEHIEYLNDPKNIRKCEGCPENIHASNWQDKLPCGQWHCQVALVSKIPNRVVDAKYGL